VNIDYKRCAAARPACQAGLGELEPQFTPDGSSLIYTGGCNGHPVIWIVPVVGGESTLLIGPRGNLLDAENGSLSPDGSLVTFLGSQIGGPEPLRWVADTDGTNRRLLPEVYGIPCRSTPTGTWSADGSRIVCSEASKVIIVDRDGSRHTRRLRPWGDLARRSHAARIDLDELTRRTDRPWPRAGAVHPPPPFTTVLPFQFLEALEGKVDALLGGGDRSTSRFPPRRSQIPYPSQSPSGDLS
jgi:hypothetical protein